MDTLEGELNINTRCLITLITDSYACKQNKTENPFQNYDLANNFDYIRYMSIS